MTIANAFLKKLTTRNILANATIGVFLYGLIYGIQNLDSVSKTLEESSLLSAFVGSFLTIVPIVYYFYFRKSQDKEKQPDQ